MPTRSAGSPRPSRPPATRSSRSTTRSTRTPSRRTRSIRPRPGSPRRSPATATRSSIPAGRLATAVRGRLRGGRGGDGPRIGILAEYDALPGLGHGCGHNTMAASGVGAAIGLAAIAAELPGEIVFLGCPAEERGSGKAQMLEDGLFDGLDAALLFHPSDGTQVGCALLASEDVVVTFTGLQAHAASDPWMGRNALDALVLLFTSIGLWRQQLPHARPGPRDRPRGRDGRQHHPGPGGRPVHDPVERPGATTSRCARGSRRCATRPPWRRTRRGEVVVLRRLVDDEGQRDPARPVRRQPGGARDRRQPGGPGAPGQLRHGQRVARSCRRSTRPSRSASPACPATRSSSATPRRRPRADEMTLIAATVVAETAIDLFSRPGARRRGLARVPRRLTRRGLTARAESWGYAATRPAGRRIRTGGAPWRRLERTAPADRRPAPPSPGGHPCPMRQVPADGGGPARSTSRP